MTKASEDMLIHMLRSISAGSLFISLGMFLIGDYQLLQLITVIISIVTFFFSAVISKNNSISG
jgi:hypothetical protein